MSGNLDMLIKTNCSLVNQVDSLNNKNAQLSRENSELCDELRKAYAELAKANLTAAIAGMGSGKSQYTDKFINTIVLPLFQTYPGKAKCVNGQILVNLGDHPATGRSYGVRVAPTRPGADEPRVGIFYDWKCFHADKLGYGCDGKRVPGATGPDIDTPATKVLEEVAELLTELPKIMTIDRINEAADDSDKDDSDKDDDSDAEDDSDKRETSNNNSGSLLTMLMGMGARSVPLGGVS